VYLSPCNQITAVYAVLRLVENAMRCVCTLRRSSAHIVGVWSRPWGILPIGLGFNSVPSARVDENR